LADLACPVRPATRPGRPLRFGNLFLPDPP
jgi:hypothetical protein